MAETAEVLDLARRICALLDEPHVLAAGVARVGASAGVVIGPDGGDGTEDLVRRADQAMYRAKQTGSGPVLASQR